MHGCCKGLTSAVTDWQVVRSLSDEKTPAPRGRMSLGGAAEYFQSLVGGVARRRPVSFDSIGRDALPGLMIAVARIVVVVVVVVAFWLYYGRKSSRRRLYFSSDALAIFPK